jgi:hypothetical protein
MKSVGLLSNRLRLSNLPPEITKSARCLLWVSIAASCLILWLGVGLPIPRGSIVIPGNQNLTGSTVEVPLWLILSFLFGSGILFVFTARATYTSGFRRAKATRVLIALIALGLTASIFSPILGLGEKNIYSIAWLAIVISAVLVVLSFFSNEKLILWCTLLFIIQGAYIFILFVYLYRQSSLHTVVGWDFYTVILYSSTAGLYSYMWSLLFLADAIFFWQALTEGKVFTRAIGRSVAGITNRFSWLLGLLLAVKFIILCLGYLGFWPGGIENIWHESLNDSFFVWILAGVYGILAVWWLIKYQSPILNSTIHRFSRFITIGFLLPLILSGLLFVIVFPISMLTGGVSQQASSFQQCFSPANNQSMASIIACLVYGISKNMVAWQQFFIALLLPLSILFWKWKRYNYLSLPMFIIGVWALPRLINSLILAIDVTFTYLTFDTVLTFILIGLTIFWYRKRLSHSAGWVLTLILVVSSINALGETLIPPALLWIGFSILLIFPMAYQFLFDAKEINEAGIQRITTVIRVIGLATGLMLLLVWGLGSGNIAPGTKTFEAVANIMFLPAILGLLLAVIIHEHNHPQIADT